MVIKTGKDAVIEVRREDGGGVRMHPLTAHRTWELTEAEARELAAALVVAANESEERREAPRKVG